MLCGKTVLEYEQVLHSTQFFIRDIISITLSSLNEVPRLFVNFENVHNMMDLFHVFMIIIKWYYMIRK